MEEEKAANKKEWETLAELCRQASKNPSPFLENLLAGNLLYNIENTVQNLQTHTHIISVYTATIDNLSQWVSDPLAVKQDIWAQTSVPPSRFVKSSWVTVSIQPEGSAAVNTGLSQSFQVLTVSDVNADPFDISSNTVVVLNTNV